MQCRIIFVAELVDREDKRGLQAQSPLSTGCYTKSNNPVRELEKRDTPSIHFAVTYIPTNYMSGLISWALTSLSVQIPRLENSSNVPNDYHGDETTLIS